LDPLTEIGGPLHRAKAKLGPDSYFGGAGLTRDALPAVRQFLALQPRAFGLHGNEKDD
jgi:hypothetical protein